jgi:hypothetical protein
MPQMHPRCPCFAHRHVMSGRVRRASRRSIGAVSSAWRR